MFRKCCAYGQVNELILDILVNSVTKDQLETVIGHEIGTDRITINDIPLEWKSNAKLTKRDARRRNKN